MLKKLSAVAALIVAFAFVTVSIAHACSGLTPMNLAVQQSPMNMGGGNLPCSKEKGDLCQSVRDSILFVKPSISAASNPQQTLPPLEFSVESLTLLVSSPAARIIGVSFHPVLQLLLTVSYLVLLM